MKLKNKYSKQIIYSNRKFEDQIWYNQQIMTFLNFHNFRKVFFAPIFQENTFLKTKPNFLLSGKYFPLTNFSNGKQTQESLESGFPETTFRKTNTAKKENTFLETKPNFSLTGKCFSLIGKCFPWPESVFRWPESVFRWPTFLMVNKHRKVWKVVSQKVNSRKQTWPKKEIIYLILCF